MGGGQLDQKQCPEHLQKALALFSEKHVFKPGDIVEWKPGMKNRRSDGPLIVVAVLEQPVLNSKEGGSQLFREPLDIILGIHARDGEFCCYHYDSRRFQPYNGQ